MTDLYSPVIDAFISRLAADSGVQALLGTPVRVHDQRPAMATFPFAVVDGHELRDASTKNIEVTSQLLTLHVFSKQRGGQEARRILAAIRTALHDASFAITGAALARCQEESATVLFDPDSQGSHGVARYRIIVSA